MKKVRYYCLGRYFNSVASALSYGHKLGYKTPRVYKEEY